jgi:Flp pilus assembly protein TadD
MIRRWMMPAVAGLLLLSAGGCARHTDQVSLREPDTASRMRIAATAAAAGQTEIALSMYSAAAEAAPNDPAVQARLVSMLLRIGKPEVAQQTLTRALTSQPRDPTLLRWLGNLRLETGSPEAALTIFDGLIARNAKDVASLNGRGVALDLLSQHDQAQESYRRAQAIAPADVQTANNLAVSYLLSDRPSQARDVLLPLSQQSELPPRVLNNLAIAQAATGSASASSAGTSTTISSDDLRTLATSLGAGIALDTPAMQSLRADKPAG